MGMNELLAAVMSLTAGAVMAVMVSCVWAVLHLPARLQDVLRAGTPGGQSVALLLGMVCASLGLTPGIHLHLPTAAGALGILLAGVFVGMLASALEKILEVAPVLLRRFRLGNVSGGVRWVMLIGKVLGALAGCLMYQ